MRRRLPFLPVFLLPLLLSLLVLVHAPPAGAAPQITPEQEKALFSRVDQIFQDVSEIMGLKIRRPVPRAIITREKIRKYIEDRMAETMPPEDIRIQEIVLKKFGFIPQDFDLKAQTVDLLTEQAAAFYDYKQRKLYLASWTPAGMQDVALVHELAHALADQHFGLEKFINKSGDDDDAATARGAVVEGQASWVMTEEMLRQMGRSMQNSPDLVKQALEASNSGSKDFPVLGASPLYLQETLMFPYNQGMLFQQAVFQKMGRDAFAEVFRHPPSSSQQILHPDLYFSHTLSTKPALPAMKLPSGYKKIAEGTLGELDHQILLRQFVDEEDGRDLAARFRGSRYGVWENKKTRRDVLYYSVEWASEADAARYLSDYRKACAKKWKQLSVTDDQSQRVSGTGDDGRFEWSLHGAVFTSVEGMP